MRKNKLVSIGKATDKVELCYDLDTHVEYWLGDNGFLQARKNKWGRPCLIRKDEIKKVNSTKVDSNKARDK